jgi:hypothetical protein
VIWLISTGPRWPATGDADYWRLTYRLLHDDDIATIDLLADSFVMCYRQRLSRIAAMTRDQIQDRRVYYRSVLALPTSKALNS